LSHQESGLGMATNDQDEKSYDLFMAQKDHFVSKLLKVDSCANIILNPKSLRRDKPWNWFMSFAPSSWGTFKHGMHGVHFSFAYRREGTTGYEYVRFSVGVENPLKPDCRKQFKADVVSALKVRNITLTEFAIWPKAGVQAGRKLVEYRVALDENAWKKIIDQYQFLMRVGFIELVADVIKEYNTRGCFTEKLQF
jgi:hypothetical protein